MSACSEQELHGQLIKPLICIALLPHCVEIKCLAPDRVGILAVGDALTWSRAALAKLTEQMLDLLVRVKRRDFLLEDQVGAHAASGKVPNALLFLGPVRVAFHIKPDA